MKSPQAPILLGKPMRKFTGYLKSKKYRVTRWHMRVGGLLVAVTEREFTHKRRARIESCFEIFAHSELKGRRAQSAANAAGKVLEKLAKAIRGGEVNTKSAPQPVTMLMVSPEQLSQMIESAIVRAKAFRDDERSAVRRFLVEFEPVKQSLLVAPLSFWSALSALRAIVEPREGGRS